MYKQLLSSSKDNQSLKQENNTKQITFF